MIQPPDCLPPPDEEPASHAEGMPPCAPDAERDVLGTILWNSDLFERAQLKASDFYIHRYRYIWQAFEAVRTLNDEIDLLSVERELKKAGHWGDNIDQYLLVSLSTDTTLHLEHDAALLREMSERRRMLESATLLARRACNLSEPLPALAAPVKTHWTPEELASAEFPEPEGPIPGLIPNGLTVLGGRPKRGKSWFMLQAGCALGLGGKFLGRDVRLGKVLYYALEDRPKRLKERIARLGVPGYCLIEFELALQPLHLGGMAGIENAARHGNYALIVIDTIRRALPGKDFTKDGALFDEILGRLQSLAGQNHTAIVPILHTRKASFGVDPDPVDDVLGSTGLTASADCVLALYTEQGKKGATLKGRGRDLDDIDLALEFDPLTNCWQSQGGSGEAKLRETEEEILAALEDLGKAQAHTIAKTLGKDYSNTHKIISSMWVAGKLKKDLYDGKTFFYLPDKKD